MYDSSLIPTKMYIFNFQKIVVFTTVFTNRWKNWDNA